MKLSAYMKRENISTIQLARELKCHTQTLYNYLHVGRRPTLEIAKKIIDYTKGEVTLEDLLTETPDVCEHCGQIKK